MGERGFVVVENRPGKNIILKAIDSIENNSEYFAEMFEMLPYAIAIIHVKKNASGEIYDFEYLYVNSKYEAYADNEKKLYLSNSCQYDREKKKALSCNYAEVAFDGKTVDFTSYIKEKDQYMHVYGYQIRYGYCVSVTEDVSDSIKYQNSIMAQKNYLKDMYNHIHNGILHLRIDDNIYSFVTANKAAYEIMGYDERVFSERYNNNFEFLIINEDKEIYEREIKKVKSQFGETAFELRFVNGNGSLQWIKINAESFLSIENNSMIQLEITDVTESKKVRMALEEEKERYRIALSNSADTIFEYNYIEDVMCLYDPYHSMKYSESEVMVTHFIRKLLNGQIVHKDDIKKMLSFIAGKSKYNIEIRNIFYNNTEQEYCWVVYEGTVVEKAGRPYKLIGKYRNIKEHNMKEI